MIDNNVIIIAIAIIIKTIEWIEDFYVTTIYFILHNI